MAQSVPQIHKGYFSNDECESLVSPSDQKKKNIESFCSDDHSS